MRSSWVTLSPSYTKRFSSLIDLVAWPVQREVSAKNIQRSRGNRKPWHGGKESILFHQFSLRIYRRYIDRQFLWAISTLLFLVAEKANRVLVYRWIISETFHDVQNVNRRCTGHATMSTERGNYRLITVHAPFLAIAPNQKSLSNCCMETLSHWPEMKNSGRCSPWNFNKKYCFYTCHTLRVCSPPKFHSNGRNKLKMKFILRMCL